MDAESQTMEMPAEYMFKGVPHYEELSDPVAEVLSLMDKHNILTMLAPLQQNEDARRACSDYPDRFAGMADVDPNQGMESVRKLERRVRERNAVCGHVWGTGLIPQIPVNDKKMYPIYAKCVELDDPRGASTRAFRGRASSWARKKRRCSTRCAGTSPSSRS